MRNIIPRVLAMLRDAKRPVLIVGNGVRLAHAEKEIIDLVDALGIPVITSWTASDLIAEHPLHIGHMGIFGDRAGNFTVQNADLLLVIGCRLSVPMIGYRFEHFARQAKIIMVDADEAEIRKPSLKITLPIVADAKAFLEAMVREWNREPRHNEPREDSYDLYQQRDWLGHCQEWRERYPVVLPEYAKTDGAVNSFHFIDQLSKRLPEDAVVVTDMGTAFTGTFQAAKMKLGQRWFTASGHAPMGYGLPGAIGAAFATGRKVICIVGDGALQMNLQELQTIVHHQLPITIFVLNNGGYRTITAMQDNHFKRRAGSDGASGVSFPDTMKIAEAYGICGYRLRNATILDCRLDSILELQIPSIIEIMMSHDQPLIPRMMSRTAEDGGIVPGALEDMYPFLVREEFNAQMVAPPIEARK